MKPYLQYLAVVGLCLLSFGLTYYVINQDQTKQIPPGVATDKLSGEEYLPSEDYSHAKYTPTFVGFNELVSKGATNDESRYTLDFITNFTMYDLDILDGKVSYVKDSFTRGTDLSSTDTTYSFKFGINNQDIHTLTVKYNMLDATINLAITDKNNSEVSSRMFSIVPQ